MDLKQAKKSARSWIKKHPNNPSIRQYGIANCELILTCQNMDNWSFDDLKQIEESFDRKKQKAEMDYYRTWFAKHKKRKS